MYLVIRLPGSLRAESLLKLSHVPCLCKIKGGVFELCFLDPLPEAVGIVHDWDTEKINERALAGGGGAYLYYCFGTVTIRREENDIYKIVDLSFFQASYPGWFPIIENEVWSHPVCRYTKEELDEIEKIDAMLPPSKLSKKKRRLLRLLEEAPQKKEP